MTTIEKKIICKSFRMVMTLCVIALMIVGIIGCGHRTKQLTDEMISLDIQVLDNLIGVPYEEVKAVYKGKIISLENSPSREYELEELLVHDDVAYTVVLMFDAQGNKPNKLVGVSFHGTKENVCHKEAVNSKNHVREMIEGCTLRETTYKGLSNKLSKFDDQHILEGSWIETYSVSERPDYEVCLYVISNKINNTSGSYSMSYLLFYEPAVGNG